MADAVRTESLTKYFGPVVASDLPSLTAAHKPTRSERQNAGSRTRSNGTAIPSMPGLNVLPGNAIRTH